MVRISAEKSKHDLESSNKYEIMYEISNIYKKNKVLAPENIFFYTFLSITISGK